MQAWQLGGPPPVEHRFLGLDRRYILPALAVLFLVLFWSAIVPAIDEAMSADEIPEGTVYTLAREVSFTPTPGWSLDGVALPATPAITMFKAGMTFDIRSGAFNGTPQDLLDVIRDTHNEFSVEGGVYPLQLSDGASGVAVQIFGTDFSGYLFAIVGPSSGDSRATGVQVVVQGPPNILPQHDDEIAQMVASIHFGGAQ
jgi:hypothetical protein